MSAGATRKLVAKDWSLLQLPLAVYTATALVAVALATAGSATRGFGVTLAITLMIGLSFHVTMGPVLGERERRTLPFVMSLPVAPRDVAVAKLLSSYIVFLVPGTVAALALVFLSPVNVFAAMGSDGRSLLSHLAGWALYFVLILGAWALCFSVVLGAAIVSGSLGWTIAVITALMFVVGNGILQLAPHVSWLVSYVRELSRGGPALPITIGVETVGVALIVAVILWLQSRKTSFV
jgi:ABC-type transport system involved in multi-copper enzyme maturation permease subunit